MAIEYGKALLAPTTDLVTTVTGAWKDFGGPDLVPMTYEVYVPAVSGTGTPTIAVVIEESANNSDATGDKATMKDITAAGRFYVTWKSNQRYRRCIVTVTGTNPNFGLANIGPVAAGLGPRW